MIETYQDEQAMEPQEPQEANFATIAGIYEDGVTLLFDGMSEATQKHYLTNASVKFAVDDRVRVIKDSGTYIVEYPVGAPLTRLVADYATEAGTATSADTATTATNFSGKHTGTTLAFFDGTPVAKANSISNINSKPSTIPTSSSLQDVISAHNGLVNGIGVMIDRINSLINTLYFYGLTH